MLTCTGFVLAGIPVYYLTHGRERTSRIPGMWLHDA